MFCFKTILNFDMDRTKVLFILLLGNVVCIQCQEEKGRLVKSLLDYYETAGGKLVIPDSHGPVNVSHSIALKRIISLENQVLTIDGLVSMRWVDNRLAWNLDDFNVTTIRLPSRYLWQPDIMLYNNADEYNGIHTGDINTVITYDGTVFYASPVKLKSFCKMKSGTMKPRHKVRCSMKFGSWTHDGFSLDLFNEQNNFDLSNYDATFNKRWKVVLATTKRNVIYYPCCPEPYIDLLYTLKLKNTGR